MLITDRQLLFFQRCNRRAYLDVHGDVNQKDPPSDFLLKLMQDSADFQEQIVADQIYHKPNYPHSDIVLGAQATLDLMKQGVEKIRYPVLLTVINPNDNGSEITLVSYPDLLVKQPGISQFGDWLYVPIDIKLGKRPKLDYQIIAAFHALVLSNIQGTAPDESWLILREQNPYSVNLENRLPQMQQVLEDYINTLQNNQEPDLFIARQKCSLCQWLTYCHAIAQQQSHLSLLPGVTPVRYLRLKNLNLTTLESLIKTTPAELEIYPEFADGIAEQVIQQALSLLQNRAIPRSRPQPSSPVIFKKPRISKVLPSTPIEIYFDIEAQPELNLDYLHGILVVDRMAQQETFYPLLAKTVEEEKKVWEQFLELVWKYPIAPIFHFCDYEPKTIRRLAQLYKTPSHLWQPLLKRFIDIHQQIVQTVTLPVESYALKPIAKWMGFAWRDPKANGAQCVYWYEQWLKTGDRTLIDSIVQYNEDDCRATYHVKQWLTDFLSSQQSTVNSQQSTNRNASKL